MKTLTIITIVLAVGGILAFELFKRESTDVERVPRLETVPQQETNSGRQQSVQKEAEQLTESETILIESPRANAVIGSPLVVLGKARGFWFFEGEFPVTLIDSEHSLVSRGAAIAKEFHLTQDFVRFEATITFYRPTTETGFLIFERVNQKTGTREERIEVPVRFSP